MRGIEFAITFVKVFGSLLSFAILARVLMSWFTMGQSGQGGLVTHILHDVTEPVISLARKLPHRVGMIDLSPMIAWIGIDLLTQMVIILIQQIPIS